MKYQIYAGLIILFVLGCFSGCATKAAVTETDYDALILRDIVQVISWQDNAKALTESMYRASIVASSFWETYPNERDVEMIAHETMTFASEILHEIVNIDVAVDAYIQMHNTYVTNKTEIQGKILYQSIIDIVADIQHLYIQSRLWEPIFDTLQSTMIRYDFHYISP
jgi:hypothetical protein